MTDKQFIETLKNIKKYCKESICVKCKFNHEIRSECMLVLLCTELGKVPENWNIEEIEKII